jgi:methyl-accepting chemotaxis protein
MAEPDLWRGCAMKIEIVHYHYQRPANEVPPWATTLLRRFDLVINTQESLMASLDALKASVSDLAAKVAAQTSLDASTATLIQGLNQQNKDLAAQIASLQVGSVTQDDIDALAKQVSDTATAIDAGMAQLQSAVPSNVATVVPPA